MGKRGPQPGTTKRPEGAGRKKGVPNKITGDLKQAILDAATLAGDKEGLVGYLHNLAVTNSSAFASLLGKVLPLTLASDPDNPPKFEAIIKFQDPK